MNTNTTTDTMLTMNDVARRLNVSRGTIRNLCLSGDLPYVRIGASYRFEAAKINAWLAARAANDVRGAQQ